MKREIKFRAWDKERSVMIGADYPDNWGDNKDEWYCDIAMMDLSGIEHINKDEDYVVMQFTGLKDKNGKGIYEGDMLGYKGNIVEFSFGCFNINGDVPIGTAAPRSEVIGNIYENPELIKK